MEKVFLITEDWWQYQARRQLKELDITYTDIVKRHELRNMDAKQTKWWMMFGRSFNESWTLPAICQTCGNHRPDLCWDSYHRIEDDL